MKITAYAWAAMARPTTRRATDFGARLTDARKSAGLTQAELEQRMSAVRQLPRDKQKVVLQFLDAFLRDTQTSKAS
jgi:transcriptional regulator with XRE-family HTH domain